MKSTFNRVKIGQLFTEDTTCEILIKQDGSTALVYDYDADDIFLDKGKSVSYEFDDDHEVELEIPNYESRNQFE